MNIAKFLKGTTTIGELGSMPNAMSHTLYKQYVEFLKKPDESNEKKGAVAEEMQEQIEDMVGGTM